VKSKGETEVKDRHNVHLAMILLAGLVLSSCDTATKPGELSAVQGSWQLQSFDTDAGGTIPIPNPERFSIRFDPDGTLGVTADCNVCGGVYETNGDNISINVEFCTLAFCGEESLDQDYLAALAQTTSFARQGQNLSLEYNEGTMRFQVSS
jgi:heat shock protein HslJ